MTRNYLVPNWARFFRIKADRSIAMPTATVAGRSNWAQLRTKSHRVGKAHCVELSLPFFVTEEKLAEVSGSSAGWTKQSHGTSVTALHVILEGHQLLPSDPKYGGSVKTHVVG
eukprot:2277839-Pyramimonas_sp.AAC.1